ncbi:MAG: hypothetical protein ABFD50_00410 [Smithella sp.]
MNFDKYNPLKQSKPPLQDWKESVPVILLSEYLRIHKDKGISLYVSSVDGEPCLHFNPPLKPSEMGSTRWEVTNNACAFLMDAADDLRELISSGLIKLPVSQRRRT